MCILVSSKSLGAVKSPSAIVTRENSCVLGTRPRLQGQVKVEVLSFMKYSRRAEAEGSSGRRAGISGGHGGSQRAEARGRGVRPERSFGHHKDCRRDGGS